MAKRWKSKPVALLILGLALGFIGGVVFQKEISIWWLRNTIGKLFVGGSEEEGAEYYGESLFPDRAYPTIDEAALSDRLGKLKVQLEAKYEAEKEWRGSDEVRKFLKELETAHLQSEPSPIEQRLEKYFFHFSKPLIKPPGREEIGRAVSQLSEISGRMKESGVHFLICNLPNKIDTEASWILGRPDYLSLSPERSEYLIGLIDAGVDVLDLRYAFGESASTGRPLFYRYDHHMTPFGMEVATTKLAEHLNALLQIQTEQGVGRFGRRFTTVPEPNSYVGFLDNKTVFGTRVVDEVLFDGKPALQDLTAPVLLVGDSNLIHLSLARNGVAADFTSRLAALLGRPLRYSARSADDGSALIEAMDGLSERKPAVIVWLHHGGHTAPTVPEVKLNADPTPLQPRETEPHSVTGMIEFVSEMPDPATAPYPDALVTFSVRPTGVDEHGDTDLVHCVVWGFRNRQTVNADWLTKGSQVTLKLQGWRAAQKADRKLRAARLLDGTLDFQSERYFVLELKR